VAAFLLDTTVLIDILRGRPETTERLRALRKGGDRAYVCAVNVEETLRGLRPSELQAATRLFAGLWVSPLGRRQGWNAGEWRRGLAVRGRTVAQADGLIAAAADALGATLATGNVKDYPTGQPPLESFAVEHWPAGA
jgi:predicted nucleic acid-binding protein